MKKAALLLLLLSVAFSLDATFYYGVGCAHCASTEAIFGEIGEEYGLEVEYREVYQNSANRAEMFALYERFGEDPAKGGVPTTLLENTTLIIGGMGQGQWEALFAQCNAGACPPGVYDADSIDGTNPIHEQDPTTQLTLGVLVGAALVDSVNPCTLAVMVMLLGVILMADGRGRMLLSGIAFFVTIFFAYMLMGLGILTAVADPGLTNIFFIVVTIGALVLAAMEINAYFRYRPGFFAVEMPMFVRPHVQKVMDGATSLPGVVVAALLCSLFLLPCSSGPYLLVLAMISKAVTLNAMLYLVLYNLVFILPMAIITVAIYFGYTTVEKMGDFREKYIKQIHLFSGVILFVLFLFMLNELLHFL